MGYIKNKKTVLHFYDDDSQCWIFKSGLMLGDKRFIVFYEDAYNDSGYSYESLSSLKSKGFDISEDDFPKETMPEEIKFSATVRFNPGSGPQQRVLRDVFAKTPDEAQKLAEAEANKEIGEDKWQEVKIRPTN